MKARALLLTSVPIFYPHLFLAYVLAGSSNRQPWNIARSPAANASDFSGYALYGNTEPSSELKLVFIHLRVWNSSYGILRYERSNSTASHLSLSSQLGASVELAIILHPPRLCTQLRAFVKQIPYFT